MPNPVAASLAATVKAYSNQLNALFNALPDSLWAGSAGAWPAWQHVAHAIWVVDVFVPGPSVAAPEGLGEDTLKLEAKGAPAPSKEALKAYFDLAMAKFDKFAASLADSDLASPNEAVAALGIPWNNAATLGSLGGHFSYHVGYCDALLTSQGLPGVF